MKYNQNLSFPRDPVKEIAESLGFIAEQTIFERMMSEYSKKIDQ